MTNKTRGYVIFCYPYQRNRMWKGDKRKRLFYKKFYQVFVNSDPNLIQTQTFTLTEPKPNPNQYLNCKILHGGTLL